MRRFVHDEASVRQRIVKGKFLLQDTSDHPYSLHADIPFDPGHICEVKFHSSVWTRLEY